ncbi:MAG: hypothetical protein ACPGVT_07650 [Maricaulaceae bacterium]
MSKLFKASLLTAGALTLAGVALASPKADTNRDGNITRAEFIAHAEARFTADDANFDGMISKDERKAGHERRKDERAAESFARRDQNGDGVITRAEEDAVRAEHKAKREERRLKKHDLNGDGILDATDKELHKAKRAEHKAKRKEMKKKRKAERKNRVKPDADGDGFVTRAEHDAATLALFTRMDANGDGVLTQGEGRYGKKRRKKMHQRHGG